MHHVSTNYLHLAHFETLQHKPSNALAQRTSHLHANMLPQPTSCTPYINSRRLTQVESEHQTSNYTCHNKLLPIANNSSIFSTHMPNCLHLRNANISSSTITAIISTALMLLITRNNQSCVPATPIHAPKMLPFPAGTRNPAGRFNKHRPINVRKTVTPDEGLEPATLRFLKLISLKSLMLYRLS